MDCESPQQLRNAHPNQPVSLGYTRQQVRAPLPHSSSTDASERVSGGWSVGDVQIQSPPSLRGQSALSSGAAGSSRSSQHRLSLGNFTVSPQHLTAQARHLGMPPTVVPMVSAYDPSGMHRQTAVVGAVAPSAVAMSLGVPLLLPEATQTGSMNLPLYGAQAAPHAAFTGAQTAVVDGLQPGAVYQAVPAPGVPLGAMHHHHHVPLNLQAQAINLSNDRERSSVRDEHVTSQPSRSSASQLASSSSAPSSSNHVARTSAATSSGAVNDRADDSPMMGICVQQSPVVSH